MEGTLKKCVESVLCQKVEPMEIIIVDDGSRDNSKEIANNLKLQYDNIKVISQKNEGLSSARNSGIEASQAEYITFVDSDDYLKEDTYEKLIDFLDTNLDCDILEYSILRSNKKKEYPFRNFSNAKYSSGYDYWFSSCGYLHCYAWNKIFRRIVFFSKEFLLPRFEVGRAFEDTDLMVRILRFNPTIITTSLGYYVYRENPKGITATVTSTAQEQLLDTHIKLLKQMYNGIHQDKNSGKKLSKDEQDYYMSIVNLQITLSRLSKKPPKIPLLNVSIQKKDFNNLPRLIKKIILKIFGIKTLCRVFCIFKR